MNRSVLNKAPSESLIIFIPIAGHEDILSEPIEVSYESSSLEGRLPQAVLENYLLLYSQAVKDPGKVTVEVEKLKKEYPGIPEMDNLLCYCLIKQKKYKQAEKLIETSYRKNPHYFFGKINYADQCLRKKKPELVPPIFDRQTSLTKLYPGKKRFHYSEFRGFAVVMAFYFLAIKQPSKAEGYYHLAMRIDPLHQSVRFLERKLFKISLVNKWLYRTWFKNRIWADAKALGVRRSRNPNF